MGPEKYNARLLHCKGKRNVKVWQVPLERKSLNEGDVFVLDAGLKIWAWEGSKSGAFERRRAQELLGDLKEERGSRPVLVTLSEDDDDPEFWKYLGGKGSVASAEAGGNDQDYDAKAHDCKLLRFNDRTGLNQEAVGVLGLDQLDSNDVFIIDNGWQIFSWVGRGASKEERSRALFMAMAYLRQIGSPVTTRICRVVEGGEFDLFLQNFPKGGKVKNSGARGPVDSDAPKGSAGSSASGGSSGCCQIL